MLGRYVEVPADLVVLADRRRAPEGARELGKLFGVSVDKDGFFAEAHPKLKPVDTTTAGVFLAGCCQSPKDIPDTVAQASAARSKAIGLLGQGEIDIDPTVAEVDRDKCSGCGECILACPYNAIERVEGRPRSTSHCARAVAPVSAPAWPRPSRPSLHRRGVVAQIEGIFERDPMPVLVSSDPARD